MDITPTNQHDGQATSSSAAQSSSNAATDDFLPECGRVLHETAGLAAINSGYLSEHAASEYGVTARVHDHMVMLMDLLAFVLAVDYGHVSSGLAFRLPSATAEHFLEVGRVLIPQCEILGFRDPEAAALDVSAMTTFCVENILEPARRTGLPVEYIAATITRFTTLVGGQARMYTGSLEHILATRGPETLASKLWFDRHVLIPRLYMLKRSEKDELIGALDRAQGRYFEALEGAGLRMRTPMAGDVGWCQLDWEKMVLTKRAQSIVDEMIRTTKQLNEARAPGVRRLLTPADFHEHRAVGDGDWGAVEAIAAAVAASWARTTCPICPQKAAKENRRIERQMMFRRKWKALFDDTANYVWGKYQT